jgi:F0F1-type ATP synthase membrane subunit a
MASATSVFFEAGRLLAIPFWFFEVFVALIQAIVFAFLMIAYFKQSAEHH